MKDSEFVRVITELQEESRLREGLLCWFENENGQIYGASVPKPIDWDEELRRWNRENIEVCASFDGTNIDVFPVKIKRTSK